MNQDFDEDKLPDHLRKSKPIEPLAEQCCGSGCSLCVYDIFEQELKIWRRECLNYFNNHDDEIKAGPAISPDYYSKFKLASITPETKDSSIYRFIIPEDKTLDLKLGQHLILRGKVDGQYVSRQYTPISHQKIKGYFDVLIKAAISLHNGPKAPWCFRDVKVPKEEKINRFAIISQFMLPITKRAENLFTMSCRCCRFIILFFHDSLPRRITSTLGSMMIMPIITPFYVLRALWRREPIDWDDVVHGLTTPLYVPIFISIGWVFLSDSPLSNRCNYCGRTIEPKS